MGGVRSADTPVKFTVPRTLRGVSALNKNKASLVLSQFFRLGYSRAWAQTAVLSLRPSDVLILITFSILITDKTCLQEPGQFLLSVEDHDHKWRSWDVFSTPLNLYPVVPRLGGFIFAQDCTIFLRFTLHFHSKSSFRSSYSYGQLTRTSTTCVANEARLIHG